MRRALSWLCLAGFVGGLLLLGSCAHTGDVKQAAQACADQAVDAAAKQVVPEVAKAIACMETTDAGAQNCAKTGLEDLLKTVAPEVFQCALAKIHDQTIP